MLLWIELSPLSNWFVGDPNTQFFTNQICVCLPVCSEANLLTLGCGEAKCSVYCKVPDKESGTAKFKKPKLELGFRKALSKARLGEGGELQGMWSACVQFFDGLMVK